MKWSILPKILRKFTPKKCYEIDPRVDTNTDNDKRSSLLYNCAKYTHKFDNINTKGIIIKLFLTIINLYWNKLVHMSVYATFTLV
jgi:hypothetical protein